VHVLQSNASITGNKGAAPETKQDRWVTGELLECIEENPGRTKGGGNISKKSLRETCRTGSAGGKLHHKGEKRIAVAVFANGKRM